MDGFLRRLGIYGYDDIEDFVLAGLVTGDPVLLVGTHGTAKTMMCERLARAMGLKFIAYDASKALFEDVLGFPDPYSIKEKKIEYVATDLSIDGKEFVLIDEISRANYQMQNKWLEIIRSRRIMGKTLDSLKYVFAAMNPPGYPGTKTLDPALSGRFCFIVWLPHFSSLKEQDKNLVISNLGDDDAKMLRRRVEEKIDYEGIKVELSSFLEDVRSRIYPEIEAKLRAPIERFIQAFAAAQAEEEEEMPIDGRRAGMMKRGLVAVLAIKAGKGKFSEDRLAEYVRRAASSLVPYSVEHEDFNSDDFEIFLEKVVAVLGGGTRPVSGVLDANLFLSRLEAAIESEQNIERRLLLLRRLSPLFAQSISNLQVRRRLVELHDEIFSIESAFPILRGEGAKREDVSLSQDETLAIRLHPFAFKERSGAVGAPLHAEYLRLKDIIARRFRRGET
jgi:MoxR-like ATPase